MLSVRHKLIRDITSRLEAFTLNTVVSGFMEHNNALIDIAKREGGIDKETLRTFAILMAPFAPHIAEEAWHDMGGEGSVFHAQWPEYDEEMTKEDTIKVPIQVNGKVKAVLEIDAAADKEAVIEAAKELVKDKISGNIVKEIYVPGKIFNLVVK